MPIAIEAAAVSPGRPDDASEAVGQSDGGDVVTAQLLAFERPLSESIQWPTLQLLSMSRQEHCASGVNQQRAKVSVTSFTDLTKTISPTT